MEAALKTFFSSPRFGVVGASSDPSKYGHKVFAWYLMHSLPVTPLNPASPSVSVRQSSYDTVKSPSALPEPASTSLSIITPPAVTLRVLKEAKEAGVPAVWLQPGSFNDEGWEYAKREFKAAIGGFEGDDIRTNAHDGWCILADGERGLDTAGREWKGVRL